MSMPRYTVMESIATISAPVRSASERAMSDFPEPVGPVRMIALQSSSGSTTVYRCQGPGDVCTILFSTPCDQKGVFAVPVFESTTPLLCTADSLFDFLTRPANL